VDSLTSDLAAHGLPAPTVTEKIDFRPNDGQNPCPRHPSREFRPGCGCPGRGQGGPDRGVLSSHPEDMTPSATPRGGPAEHCRHTYPLPAPSGHLQMLLFNHR
jgi:hypothetical protein